MVKSDSAKWNDLYQKHANGFPSPARVVADYYYLLPAAGRALDLACGRGGNALALAAAGLETHAWDISQEALAQLRKHADEKNLKITTRLCDLTIERPDESYFDVIVVSRYLERPLAPFLSSALNEGGLLFYQTFITDKLNGVGPSNPQFLLEPNELLHLFADLRILLYREEGLIGDLEQGLRNEAMLIGQKR